jgi:pimeloyl-ACP methyl ester carboxylesterase
VSISPNIRPDSSAVYQWDIDNVSRELAKVELEIKNGNNSTENIRKRELLNLIDNYPNIENSELLNIKSPVLLIAGDGDVIKLEHILEIYQNIPKAHLFIMPGATHFMISSEHELLNLVANRFLSTPFKRPTTKEILSN